MYILANDNIYLIKKLRNVNVYKLMKMLINGKYQFMRYELAQSYDEATLYFFPTIKTQKIDRRTVKKIQEGINV